jgi:hypothetical protein
MQFWSMINIYELTTLVVIGTYCTGSCNSNYLTITTVNQFIKKRQKCKIFNIDKHLKLKMSKTDAIDLRQVDGFPPETPLSSTNKTDRYDRTEILLKVVLNTITLTLTDCVSSLCFLCLSLNVVIGVLKIYNIYR